jgi:methyltransferase (TIGR00027 family)
VDEYDDWDIVSGVGITALMVAAGRSIESSRDDALIEDPYAEIFVTHSGMTRPIPTSWAALNDSEGQSEADTRWVNVWTALVSYLGVRSRFFDEYFRDASTAGVRQVVILAAGLDTRAFRLSWPAHVELFEIDQPKVLEFKDTVLEEVGALAGCARHVVPIDLRADWPEALLRANFDPQRPTAWLAEGLLPYLPGTAEKALFAHVHRLSAAGSWFATEESDPDIRSRMHEAPSGTSTVGTGMTCSPCCPMTTGQTPRGGSATTTGRSRGSAGPRQRKGMAVPWVRLLAVPSRPCYSPPD